MILNNDNNGNNNVIIGNRSINGSGNVIIDAVDLNGNTILNRPMIIGNNAKGAPGDIVIGANAGSGLELFLLLDQLKQMVNNQKTIDDIQKLLSALQESQKNKSKIQNLWNGIEKAVTVGNAIVLVTKIAPIIGSLFLSI